MIRKYKERYLLLIPALLLFVVFRYVPMAGIVLAWKQFNVTLGLFGSPWAGWKYFQRLLDAPDFFRVVRNTLFINKDGTEGALLGVRMISPAHIVPPVDKVYIAPNRHALQSWIESHQTSGPGIGFRPAWNEDERALAGNLKTIEQEFAWKGLTGAIDIAASWDGYVQDTMDAGLAQLLESLADKGM